MSQFEKYKKMVRQLLDSEQGCEWIKAKTIQDIGAYSLEEIYELIDALESNDYPSVKNELADLFFHVMLYAEMAEQKGAFCFDDVIDVAIQKQKERRLPLEAASSAKEAHQHWQTQKYGKRLEKDPHAGLLDDIPKNMPALIRSNKIQDRVGQVGFDWERVEQVIEKLKEETVELETEVQTGDRDTMMDELGDILFTTVNIARHIGVDPEQALRFSNDKFARRFRFVEQAAKHLNMPLNGMSFDAMLALWEEAKLKEKKP